MVKKCVRMRMRTTSCPTWRTADSGPPGRKEGEPDAHCTDLDRLDLGNRFGDLLYDFSDDVLFLS